MALREYLTTEVGEDWVDGLIGRREAIRRLILLGMTATSASALLAACAAEVTTSPSASSGATPASSAAASQPGTSRAPSSPGAGSPGAGSPGAGTAGGQAVTFAGPRGELQGFFAPAASPSGAMLVIHENRGLTDQIRSVATRLAGDGYAALAVDLLSEEGGTAALGGEANVPPVLAAASPERLVGDMRAGLDELGRRAPGSKLGIIGFCFGGGMVWTLLDAGEPRLAAAIPFYGPAPSSPDFSGDTAAVLGVYAENDSRVNGSRDAAAAALTAAGLTHEIKTYPGVDHAFFNDTGARYNPTQAAAAYADVLAWLGRHLSA
jgi:carboxymethylenebutenolidase